MMAKKNTPGSGNENKIELGMLTDLLGYHLRRAQINTFRQFANTFGKDRVTPTQLTIMILVEQNPGISQVDVGRILDMDRATDYRQAAGPAVAGTTQVYSGQA